MTKPLSALAIAIAVLLTAIGCVSRSDERDDAAEWQVATGRLTAVEARTMLKLERLQITDEAGTVWNFRPGADGAYDADHAYTPSHLRQHMTLGIPLIVSYTEEGGALIIQSISE